MDLHINQYARAPAGRPANYYCRRQAAQIKNNRNANLLFGVERARARSRP
jgi:hypothetical protein